MEKLSIPLSQIIICIIKEIKQRLLHAIVETYIRTTSMLINMLRNLIPFRRCFYFKSEFGMPNILNRDTKKTNALRDYVVRPGGFIRYYGELLNNPNMTITDKMCFEINRLASFSLAHPAIPVSAVKLAKEGFYYVLESQTCKCVFCGVEKTNWLSTDDPTEIHRRLSPECPFFSDRLFARNVSMLTGDSGLPQTGIQAGRLRPPAVAQHGYTSSLQPPMSLLDDQSGYPRYVLMARRMETLSNWNRYSFANVLRPASYLDEAGFYYTGRTGFNSFLQQPMSYAESLQEENRYLRDQTLCRICLENSATITLLPCGHQVCCDECLSALHRCPICREHINGNVRTYLA